MNQIKVLAAVAKIQALTLDLTDAERVQVVQVLTELVTAPADKDQGPRRLKPKPGDVSADTMGDLGYEEQAAAVVREMAPRMKRGVRCAVVARRLGKTNGAANCQLRKALRAGLLVRTERGRY